jgi:hypothetical protein
VTIAPDAVRDVNAHFYGGEHHIAVRLLADPLMKKVWKEILKESHTLEMADTQKFKDRLDSLPRPYRMETWGAPISSSLAEQACASFFLATSIIFAERARFLGDPPQLRWVQGNSAIKESDIRKESERYENAAKACRDALLFPHRAASDPALAAALTASAVYFDEWIKVLKRSNMNSPYLVERETGGGDDLRAQVRHVATVTREMFGTFMYRTAATVSSVATGSAISWQNVKNWCKDDLTLPSSTS